MAKPVCPDIPKDILVHLLSFIEPDRRYAGICRAFRAANLELRKREGKKLDISRVVHEAHAQVTQEEVDRMVHERRLTLPLIFLNFYNDQLEKTPAFLSRTRALLDGELTENPIKAFLVREKLSARFCLVAQQANPLQALHASQRQEVRPFSLHVLFDMHAERTIDTFAQEKFVRSEEIVHDACYEAAKSLKVFWQALRNQHYLGPHGGVPPADASPEEIEVYMNSNPLPLAQIATFNVDNLTVIPDRIGLLTGLKKLTIGFAADVKETVLPGTFALLQNLEILSLKKAKFAEFPDVVLQLPQLMIFTMPESKNTFTSITEAAWNHVGRGWVSSLLASMAYCAAVVIGQEYRMPYEGYALGTTTLKQMPFTLWLQKMLMPLDLLVFIPSPFLLPLWALSMPIGALLEMDTGIALVDLPVRMLGVPLLLGWGIGVLGILAPFVLLNFILKQGILFVAERIRTALGYPAMVIVI